MLKSMAQSARAENRDNLLVQILVSCFEFLLSVSGLRGVCWHSCGFAVSASTV
jgi:hypothetical protein